MESKEKYWKDKYEDTLIDAEILSEKSIRLAQAAKTMAWDRDEEGFDWNLTEEIEYIASKYKLI